MAERKCVTCDQPVRSSAIRLCFRCQAELRTHLGMQQWMRTQLLIEFRRQARKQARHRSNGLAAPILFDDRAARLMARQAGLLGWYTGIVLRARGGSLAAGPICAGCRHRSCKALRASRLLSSTLGGATEYLARNIDILKRNHHGQALLEQLRLLDAAALRLVDLPEMRTRFAAGPCPKLVGEIPCRGRVDACVPADEHLPPYLLCNICGARWPSWEWNGAGSDILARETQLTLQAEIARRYARKAP